MPTSKFPARWVRVPWEVRRLEQEFQVICNLRPRERPAERQPDQRSLEWIASFLNDGWAVDAPFKEWLASLELPTQILILMQGSNGLRLTVVLDLSNIYWTGSGKNGYPRLDRTRPKMLDHYICNLWGGFILAAASPTHRMQPTVIRDPRGRAFCALVKKHVQSGTLVFPPQQETAAKTAVLKDPSSAPRQPP